MSNADRQRRYRERRRAEQREQVGISTVTPGTVTRNALHRNAVTLPAPDAPDLGTRGRRLWEQLTSDGTPLRPTEQVLAEEACRTADRLDVLDRVLRGDADDWIELLDAPGPDDLEDERVMRVVVNGALAEARQQQIALKTLLAELRQSRAGGAAGKPAGRTKVPTGTGGAGRGVTDLTSRIAAKRGHAPG